MNLINKWVSEKREYKKQMARVKELPEDYRFVFEKMQGYMWRVSEADGSDILKTQHKLIALLEESASKGLHVLEVTGKDVAGFCDEFLQDTKKWMDRYRDRLNEVIRNNE